MSTGKKVLIFVSVLILIVGVALLTVGLINSKTSIVTNEHIVTEEFNSFNINMETANLRFAKATDDKVKVVCTEKENNVHTVSVSDNTLNITNKDTRKWYQYMFMFNLGRQEIVVYLPTYVFDKLYVRVSTADVNVPGDFTFNNIDTEASTGDIIIEAKVNDNARIHTSTGDIEFSKANPKNVDVLASTGRINLKDMNVTENITAVASTGRVVLENINAKNLNVTTSTGRITLSKVVLEEKMNLKASTGDVKLIEVDAKEIKIETSTGDVEGTVLTPKSFYTKTNTGSVNVPRTTGDICDITTSTGDISVSVK